MHNTPKKATRLLMVASALYYGGGAEKLVVQLALSLKKLYPYDIHIAYLEGGKIEKNLFEGKLPLPLIPQLEQAHIPHSWLKKKRDIPPKNHKFHHIYNLLQTSLRLTRVVKHFRPHILHSHSREATMHSSLVPISPLLHIGGINGKRQQPTFHGMREYLWRKWMQWRIHQHVTVSQRLSHYWQEKYYLSSSLITVIPPPIADIFFDAPQARTLPSKNTPIRIGIAGRLAINHKRQDLAIQACDILHQKGIQATLSIAGGGGDEEKIREIAGAYPKAKVHFAGSLNDEQMRAWYDSLDILMLSSYYEAFGMVLAEGAARGLPFVATDTEGPPEIDEGAGNVIVPRGDAQALAKGVETLLADEKRYSTVSEKNIALSERYKGDLIAKKYHQIYQSLLLHA